LLSQRKKTEKKGNNTRTPENCEVVLKGLLCVPQGLRGGDKRERCRKKLFGKRLEPTDSSSVHCKQDGQDGPTETQ
jgi:hypothetical protein